MRSLSLPGLSRLRRSARPGCAERPFGKRPILRSPIPRLGRRGQRTARSVGIAVCWAFRQWRAGLPDLCINPLAVELVSVWHNLRLLFRGDAERATGPLEAANPAIAWTLLDPMTRKPSFPAPRSTGWRSSRPQQHLAYVLLNSLNLDNQSFAARLPIQRGTGRHEHSRSD